MSDHGQFTHHIQRMSGRDPHERGRVATPLELLFDLTFAAAFASAASQFAHLAVEGYVSSGLIGFGFACFAICWAWINFSWFASAYDTDDWAFRVVTMVQMIGVLVLTIGLPRMFVSVEHGQHLDNSVMVLGYVIMRGAMIVQWLRAARQDPAHRRACLTYAVAIAIAQIGWIVQIFEDFSLSVSIVMGVILLLIELAGPIVAESRDGGTPWHAHHIAERYSLLTVIALGEGIVGSVAQLAAIVGDQGWTLSAAMIGIAGTGLTFGLWWVYYMLPSAEMLHAYRERAFVWGYGHMLIIVAVVATGAGLDVGAYYIQHKSHISELATMLTTAIPVAAFLGLIYALYAYLTRSFNALHIAMLAASAAIVILSILMAKAGVNFAVCLVVLAFAPVATIVIFEVYGYRDHTEVMDRHREKHKA